MRKSSTYKEHSTPGERALTIELISSPKRVTERMLPVEHGKPADYSRLQQEQLSLIRATLKDLKLIIIDKMRMVSSLTLLYIHLRLTEVTTSDEAFGRISIVCFRDSMHLPPQD